LDDINEQVAQRLRRLRRTSGMSLEELSKRSGVSRATLSQIETLKTNPTIAVLWKISHGLDVSFAELLGTEAPPSTRLSRAADARYLFSADRTFRSRPLLSNVPGHKVEVYQLQLDPRAIEQAEPHPDGSYEQIIVTSGKLGLGLGQERYELASNDALLFRADVAHSYECVGSKPFVGLSLILYPS
jgi:transcriptional regulator with XRE-family HTH domain